MNYKNNHLIKGVLWSGVDKFGVVVFQLILELFLARLLLPSDYGVIGIILVFVTLAITFTEGGFSNALIHKQNRTEEDYAAVFYFNISIGLFVYLLIFLAAPYVETYFKIVNLALYLRITCISILFSCSVLVHRTILTLQMDFKRQAKYSLISVSIAGGVSLTLAYMGFGVWALIIQTLILNFLNTILFWFGLKWLPRLKFSLEALKTLFNFGSKVLISSIIQNVYFNTYPVIIGKLLNSRQLGLYSKSNQFTQMPASVLTTIVQRVLFPLLTSHQNNDDKINKLNRIYTFICCIGFLPLFFTLAIVAKPLIIITLSIKWAEMIPVFTILCVAYTFYPITVNNMMLFQVKNRTGLFLKIEILTKCIGLFILFLTIKHGIIAISFGILAHQFLQFIITSIYTQSLLGKELLLQIKIVVPFYLFAVFLYFALTYFFDNLHFSYLKSIFVGIVVDISAYSVLYFVFYRKVILEIISIIKRKQS